MKKILVFLILVMALVLTACGSTATTTVPADPTDIPTTEPVEAAASSNFPSGKFIKAGTTNYGLLFNADETFSVFEGDYIYVNATYTVEGDVFTETSNTGGCETNVSFTYIFDGTNLTFNYVGDPNDDTACDGRHADFNNVTYILAKTETSNFPTGKFEKSGSENYGLVFNEDGTFFVYNSSNGIALINGTYSVDGDFFTETSNTGGCVSPMKFKYRFNGTYLTFNYVDNPDDDNACDGRKADFNNVTYTLTK